VTVGQALTEARAQAGLTVDELSERTRIRGTVIRSIEQDDYEACGGDLYVRGYVRAIAGAVGIDAQPLIREFDQGRAKGVAGRANGSVGRHALGMSAVATTATTTRFDLAPVPYADNGAGGDLPADPADPATTRFDLPAVSEDPAATAFDLPVVADIAPAGPIEQFTAAPVPPAAQPPRPDETRSDRSPVTEDLMAAGYDLPRPAQPVDEGSATKVIPAVEDSPAGPQVPAARRGPSGDKRRRGFLIVGAVIVVIAAGVLVAHLATGKTATTDTAATSAASSSSESGAAAAQASASAAAQASASAAAQSSASAAAAQSSAAAKSSQAAAAQPVTTLSVASAVAFGPDGASDGDSPSTAKNAIAANPTQPWATQWYVTPTFGMLKHGTGLLLDLGSKVTITSVSLDIAQNGGTLQLRAGDGAALSDLGVVTTAANASGAVKITLSHPVTARYLLIWFTKLASDGSGHYQESAAHVKVTGSR
jgi:cytoskeletal protein RodZ